MDDGQLSATTIPRLLGGEYSFGELSSLGEPCEPFGELSFFKMIDVFYDKAYALDEEGCDGFLLEDMESLTELRAAVIACRRLEKPVAVMLEIKDEDCDTMGGIALAWLITLQEMGVCSFGIKAAEDCPRQVAEDLCSQLYPYAKVPIFARLEAGKVIVSDIRRLISLGVGGFDCRGVSPAELDIVRIELDRADLESKKAEKEDTSFVAANDRQAFFLNPENITFSPQIDIECDMADELVDFEDEAFDCISVLITTHDDGFRFSQNVHFLGLPIMFSAQSEETLRMALEYYNGRALVDSQCGIDADRLSRIASEFGAIIY